MRSLIFLILFSCTSYAQPIFQPVVNISNTGWATSDYHSVNSHPRAGTNDFQYLVVWQDNGEIMFRKSTDYGQNWSPNKIISTTSSICGWPVIAGSQSDEKIFVLYHTSGTGGIYEIIHQRSIDGGVNWSAMQKISGPASAITPQLICDYNNKLYAVWEERPNNNYEIYFSKSTDFGSTWSAPVNVSNTPATSRWVQIVSHGNDLYCGWIETTSYPLSDIYLSKSTDQGNTWSTGVNITNDARPQNRFHLVYEDYTNMMYMACDDIPGSFNYDEIYLMKSSDQGTTWTSPVNITNNAGNSNTPSFYASGDYIFFAWSDNSHSPTFDNTDIFLKISSDQGNYWSTTYNISENAETSSRPRFCYGFPSLASINLLLVWYDYSLGDAEILGRSCVYPVPVELIMFKAESEGTTVHLNWITASEKNNKGFQIERTSPGSIEWQIAGFVEGKGTTTEVNHYTFTEQNLERGKYIYRLKQIDFDGTHEYSNETEVEVSGPEYFYLLQNYPNPFNPVTTIKYYIPSGSAVPVKMVVYDVTGRETAVLVDEQKSPGEYAVQFDGKNLPSGIYLCRLSAGEYNTVIKISLLK